MDTRKKRLGWVGGSCVGMRCGSGAVIYYVEWMSAGIAVRLSLQPLGGYGAEARVSGQNIEACHVIHHM